MAINKVVYSGNTLIDITDTTATASDVAEGKKFYGANGVSLLGTAPQVHGIPSGGDTNQVLIKSTNDDYDVGWASLSAEDVGALSSNTAIPSCTSDLVNDSNFITGMYIAKYGITTYAEVLEAYTANKIVYCRASSNSNPASGSQTRMAFLAYVQAETNPTEFEFQYYRSVSSHTFASQGDQVYVYKLNKNNGWSVTVREAYTKIIPSTGLSSAYTTGTKASMTLSVTNPLPEVSTEDNGKILMVVNGVWTAVEPSS